MQGCCPLSAHAVPCTSSIIWGFSKLSLVSVDYIHSATSVTPLMVAAGRGFPSLVEQLLALGANANLRASNGWTALDWAKRFNQAEVVELLEAHM